MTKKVALSGSTPDDEKRYSLKNEHDFLTPRLGREPVLAIVELGVATAGGHDDQGNQLTTLRVRHLEHASTPEDEERLEDLFTEFHANRTGNASRPSEDSDGPSEAAGPTLPGMGDDIDDSPEA
jgi:hypothetical protein